PLAGRRGEAGRARSELTDQAAGVRVALGQRQEAARHGIAAARSLAGEPAAPGIRVALGAGRGSDARIRSAVTESRLLVVSAPGATLALGLHRIRVVAGVGRTGAR